MTHGAAKDIVERLRKQAGWHIDNQKMVTGPLLDEAAAEIDRLRKTLREIVDSSNDPRAVREARAALRGKP